MGTNIAIIGLACEFPGARTPEELFETALTKRRWFRQIPPCRLGPGYQDHTGLAADTTRLRQAALIEGYSFPHGKFVMGSDDMLAADFSHWLALDCAARAWENSGLGDTFPREATRVIVGNTLTGESSRADLLRLRWPYVRKVLEESGCGGGEQDWERREESFKARLTPVDGRTLAGALSNVIAGRIAGYLNTRGGAYCVDAACASSLVAIAQACSQLASGETDCCIAGGVDVSLDPLELVGFSVAGALAKEDMKVFDRDRSGFLPGEGCGFAVLMRADDPRIAGRQARAVIRGWSVSSDGRHDLTAPSADGQRLALERAYAMAGYGIGTVPLFEAHGTGTVIGDEVEIGVLLAAIEKEPAHGGPAAAVGTIKANIGHTKAAAGMAGLIKAVRSLETGVIPPVTGCENPMPELCRRDARLRLPEQAEAWPEGAARRAGVSGFGFGGVNVHVTLEAAACGMGSQPALPRKPRQVPFQEVEVFTFDGLDLPDLRRRVEKLKRHGGQLAEAELAPAAAATQRTLKDRPWRAAVIASSPTELDQRLSELLNLLATPDPNPRQGKEVFIGRMDRPARIGFMFPGQGGSGKGESGAMKRRFGSLSGTWQSPGPEGKTEGGAAWTQASIVSCATGATRLLAAFGISPCCCLGHSLGEIPALHAAGAMPEDTANLLAWDRGRIMDAQPATRGQMQVLFTGGEQAAKIVNGHTVALAAYNSPRQTVISGAPEAVAAVAHDARRARVTTARLPVEFAFHSPLMHGVEEPFLARLREITFHAPSRAIYSTVTGGLLPPGTDFPCHLVRQLTQPVRFHEAHVAARDSADLWIEVGAGRVLWDLTKMQAAVPLEAESASLAPFLRALAMAFVHGTRVKFELLHEDRGTAFFDLDWEPSFFTNPCERRLPQRHGAELALPVEIPIRRKAPPSPGESADWQTTVIGMVKAEIVRKKGKEFSVDDIRDHQRLGPELGIDSLRLTELEASIREKLGGAASREKPRKTMTVAEFAALFSTAKATQPTLSDLLVPWVRAFEIEWDEVPLANSRRCSAMGNGTSWKVVSSTGSGTPGIAESLASEGETGLLIHCTMDIDTGFMRRMLEALQTHPNGEPVVFMDATGQLAGFAKSFALEQPEVRVLFIHLADDARPEIDGIADEFQDAFQFREIRFTGNGGRLVPRCRLKPLRPMPASHSSLTQDDVVLVTGGAKGITAECMVALAARTNASFAIVGRSPTDDPAVRGILEKLRDMSVCHHYWPVDIADATAVAEMIPEIETTLGSVSVIIHGAGEHRPCEIQDLSAEAAMEHCRVKEQGLRNLLACVRAVALKQLFAFGSVIARTGYPGSAAYAFANDRLARLVARYQSENPGTRCATLDWSVWEEAGMGVKLGAVEAMKQRGVAPIQTIHGIHLFLDALESPDAGARPILAGRLPDFATLSRGPAEGKGCPAEWQIVHHTPGVELVVDIPLSRESHRYLEGHSIDGQIVLPGVLCLELMEAVARCLEPFEAATSLQAVKFERPITIPESGNLHLRVQTIVQADGGIECFLAPHDKTFAEAPAVLMTTGGQADSDAAPIPFPQQAEELPQKEGREIARELYNRLLFHTGGFRRVERYSAATANECRFHLRPADDGEFSADVLVRDSFIHGIQVCVPGELLLPAEIGLVMRIQPVSNATDVTAREISAPDDGTFIYDLDAFDLSGNLVEAWRGLVLKRYCETYLPNASHPVLLAIHEGRLAAVASPTPEHRPQQKRYFEYRHTVGFKDTNLVGNVYFTNHIEWQGRCREMFLKEHCPEILEDFETVSLVTVKCACEYFQEIHALDQLAIRMTLEKVEETKILLSFHYFRLGADEKETLIARGDQELSCIKTSNGPIEHRELPKCLIKALFPFQS